MKPVVTIIIAAFNAQEYLPGCLNSVLKQTFTDYEVIVVDDGSCDGSAAILQKYTARFQQISVLTSANGGPGAARNIGLDHARGDYILFLDADDKLKPLCLETCVGQMRAHQLDLLFFSTQLHYFSPLLKSMGLAAYYQYPQALHGRVLSAEQMYQECLEALEKQGHGYPVVVWGYMFDRLKYQTKRFRQRIYEDELFTTDMLLSAPLARVKVLKTRLHIHSIHPGSLTTSRITLTNISEQVSVLAALLPLADKLDNPVTLNCLRYNLKWLVLNLLAKNKLLDSGRLAPQELIQLLLDRWHASESAGPGPVSGGLMREIIAIIAPDGGL
ncbi:glycosyltransferase family 2 protein [Pantoea sp. B65]|uniref:glycosyltransferase family 2 protein n=1 Tax=Pantoea sp. B65 TaxID=2813359 RepID=UPI0039B4D826